MDKSSLPALRHDRTPRFEWSQAEHLQLLIDGAAFYPHLIETLHKAQRRIWIELYLISSGSTYRSIALALTAACQRGVDVRLIIDGLGGQGLHDDDRLALQAAGVQLRVYNPTRWRHPLRSLLRDHRKILIIDDQAYTGGAGISDDFAPLSRYPWRETMLFMQGPVVEQWSCLFLSLWPETPPTPTAPPPAAGGVRVRVNASQADLPQHLQASLLRAIARSHRQVWLATPYFLPPRRLRKALRLAARRGVDVRLLIPGRHNDHPFIAWLGQSFLSLMGQDGVQVFEYHPRFLHTKVWLCDDWCSLGSSNMDRWGMFWNLEANLEIDDAAFAATVQAMLREDFAQAQQLKNSGKSVALSLLRLMLHRVIEQLERWRRQHKP